MYIQFWLNSCQIVKQREQRFLTEKPTVRLADISTDKIYG